MKSTILTIALLVVTTLNIFASSKSIQVQVKGDGEPVLLLPGFTCPGEIWEETVAEISSNHECHIVSYAGFGDIPAIDTLWLQTIKQDLGEYIKQNDLKKLSIIGHSMGGTLALWLASDKQFDVKNIVVIDALPCMGAMMIPNYSSENISYNTPYNQNLLKMTEAEFAGMAKNFSQYMSRTESKHEQIASWIKKADRKTYVNGYTDLLKLDLRKDLSNIESRVLILAAANPSKSMVEGVYNNQYSALKEKEIIFIENSAHFIMYDQFKNYIQQVKQFVN